MRPQPSDYAPFFEKYVCLVPDGDIVELLVQAKADVTTLLQFLPPDKWDYRYAEGKWSIRELILHMIDTERIFSYRALSRTSTCLFPMPITAPGSLLFRNMWQFGRQASSYSKILPRKCGNIPALPAAGIYRCWRWHSSPSGMSSTTSTY